MWEWSNNKNAPLLSENDSLRKAYASYLPQTPPVRSENSEEIPSIRQMEELLRRRMTACGLKDIELRLMDFKPLSWETKHRYSEEQVRGRKIFLKILGYSHAGQCLRAGLDEADIALLKQSISPENYTVHIRIPFDFGGQPSLDNMCLVRTHPLHDQLHTLLEYQLEKNFLKRHKKLYIPVVEGIVKNA